MWIADSRGMITLYRILTVELTYDFRIIWQYNYKGHTIPHRYIKINRNCVCTTPWHLDRTFRLYPWIVCGYKYELQQRIRISIAETQSHLIQEKKEKKSYEPYTCIPYKIRKYTTPLVSYFAYRAERVVFPTSIASRTKTMCLHGYGTLLHFHQRHRQTMSF